MRAGPTPRQPEPDQQFRRERLLGNRGPHQFIQPGQTVGALAQHFVECDPVAHLFRPILVEFAVQPGRQPRILRITILGVHAATILSGPRLT